MAADGHTKNFQGLVIFKKFFMNFSQKIQYKTLLLDMQLTFSIVWVSHLKMSPKSKKNKKNKKKMVRKCKK